jgi:hypothetical protein
VSLGHWKNFKVLRNPVQDSSFFISWTEVKFFMQKQKRPTPMAKAYAKESLRPYGVEEGIFWMLILRE